MKCPYCGLVHAASEQVCRRCEVDLRTSEPRPRAMACVAVTETPSPLDRLLALIPSRTPKAEPARTPAPTGKPAPAPRTHESAKAPEPIEANVRSEAARNPASFFRAQKEKFRLPAFLRGKEQAESAGIACVQCAEAMCVEHESPYPFWQPLALWVMGAGLLIAGIFFHLLIITGLLAVIAGVFFYRLGGSHWRCSSCGMIVPRAR